ncbi:hypothetical protein [Sphingobacterium sp. FBM7-1]|uniref:hypothetical protein n=1 Tax=Sphingobacterium sp. FBM7-1 TaxID=2886688 RepID=UPI001D11C0F3|nr:hypothetical protein [Sphingobacterium sp. FBM7-1]MCC2600332.1 hypothetical protein [Sphingobacterium sp. FBM7-1]
MKKIILYMLFGLAAISARAHEGIGLTQDYGNVRVLSYKDNEVEAFRKAFIIGQLVEKLAHELKYSHTIYLDFRHNMFRQDSLPSVYHVAFETFSYSDEEGEISEKLVVRQYANDYDASDILKLVEYAVEHKSIIKQQQAEKENAIKYGTRKFPSIDDKKIRTIQEAPTSPIVEKIMHTRIDRPLFSDERPSDITYYWQEDQYHIYRHRWGRKDDDQPDVVLLTVPSIQQFATLDLVFLIFDTPSSFYYLNINHYDKDTRLNKVSSHHIIEDVGEIDFGKEAAAISDGDVSIYFTHGAMGWGKKRVLLYFYATETLIQNVYAAAGVESSNPGKQLREAYNNALPAQ